MELSTADSQHGNSFVVVGLIIYQALATVIAVMSHVPERRSERPLAVMFLLEGRSDGPNCEWDDERFAKSR